VGTLIASTKHGKLAAAKPPRPAQLGTVTGTVPGGHGGRLAVRLTSRALASLRRLHELSANLTAIVTSAGGSTHLGARLSLVRAAASRKHKH
jgi:hypothetical protein